jgi:hypothetical protein
MNKYIELVKKWLADPTSVTQQELYDNRDAAYAYAYDATAFKAAADYAVYGADDATATAFKAADAAAADAAAYAAADATAFKAAADYAVYGADDATATAFKAADAAADYAADYAAKHWVKRYEELTEQGECYIIKKKLDNAPKGATHINNKGTSLFIDKKDNIRSLDDIRRIAELESNIRKLINAITLEFQENVMAELEELLKEQE